MIKSLTMWGAALAMAWVVTGCSGKTEEQSDASGTLGLPLKTYAASGVEYRLRDAEFSVWGYPESCWSGDGACEYYEATIDGEDYLDQDSILLDLEAGDYEIYLNPGWRLEKTEDGETEEVEAVLLNGDYQWVWVSPRSTSWVSFEFGVGDREIWLNGQVNLTIEVYEDPDDYYWWGSGGAGGYGGYGGEPAIGGMTSGGSYPDYGGAGW